MMRRIFTVAGLIAITSTTVAFASGPADWKVYGMAKVPTEVVLFYLDSEITRTDGHVQVWIKALDFKRLNAHNNYSKSEVMNKAAKLVANYYMPPLGAVEDVNVEKATQLTIYEQLADEAVIGPTLRILYEIDCGKKLARTLSLIRAKSSPSDDVVQKWVHVPPESNSETLGKLTCRPT